MVCENCKVEHDGSYGSGRFCSSKCARGFSTKIKRNEINAKVSESLSGSNRDIKTRKKISEALRNRPHDEERKRKLSESKRRNYINSNNITSLSQFSFKTITRILNRMPIGCSRCGWNESTCDVHHINGRKVEDANSEDNLCYLCPNCHRLFHTKKISKDELIPLSIFISDTWKDYV